MSSITSNLQTFFLWSQLVGPHVIILLFYILTYEFLCNVINVKFLLIVSPLNEITNALVICVFNYYYVYPAILCSLIKK